MLNEKKEENKKKKYCASVGENVNKGLQNKKKIGTQTVRIF